MLDWLGLVVLSMALAVVAVWTVRIQRRHDSPSVVVSAAAVAAAILPLGAFTIHLVGRTLGLHPSFVMTGGAFVLSLIAGPCLFVVACRLRASDSLPSSVSILQLCHVALWGILTLLGLSVAFAV